MKHIFLELNFLNWNCQLQKLILIITL